MLRDLVQGLSGGEFQNDSECRPAAWFAFHFNPSAVVCDDAPCLGKAKPQATAGLPGGIEGVEDVASFLGLQPRPVVANANPHFATVGQTFLSAGRNTGTGADKNVCPTGIAFRSVPRLAINVYELACRRLDGNLDVAAALQSLKRVLANRPQSDLELRGIGRDEDRTGIAAAADGRLLAGRPRRQIGRYVVDQSDQLDLLKLGPRRPRKEHHVGDHFIHPHRLRADQRQRVTAFGVRLVAQQKFGAAGNNRQGVVDFMAGPGGELRHRLELVRLKRPLKIEFQLRQSGDSIDVGRRAFHLARRLRVGQVVISPR